MCTRPGLSGPDHCQIIRKINTYQDIIVKNINPRKLLFTVEYRPSLDESSILYRVFPPPKQS